MLKKNTPEISVVMTVYNASLFLDQAITNILNQTFTNFELICVNDGSTDKSLQILNNYKKKDSRLKILTQQNKGTGAARNAGLKEARGKWLLFLDSDDFFEPTMLEKMLNLGIKDQSEVVCAGFYFYYLDHDIKTKKYPEKLLKMSPVNPKEINKKLFSILPAQTWSKLFLTKKIKQNKLLFEDLPSCNDLTFVYTACALASKISFMNDCFVHYRTNTGTNISAHRGDKAVSVLYAFKALYQNLIEHNLYQTFEKTFLQKRFSSVFFELSQCSSEEKKILLHQIKQILPKKVLTCFILQLKMKEFLSFFQKKPFSLNKWIKKCLKNQSLLFL